MHNAAFRSLGMDWAYEMLDIPRNQLSAAVDRLRAPDVGGANVTIPYKQAVMEHLDTVAPEAVRARAVNTIVNDDGRLGGFNTDIAAIRMAIDEVGLEPEQANAVILGAGGAARAAAVAIDGAHITFVARRPHDADVPGKVVAWDDPSVATAGAVVDLVYVTGGTPLVRKARSLGLPAVDGWEILLAQGSQSFLMWTGRSAPLDAMRETLDP